MIKRLIIDADDTLWENNVYFNTTTNNFYDLAVRFGMPRDTIRNVFLSTEHEMVEQYGYGSENFLRIMYHISDTDPHLAGNTVFRSELDRIIDDFMSHRDGPPPLFDGVRATLTQLSQKYRLYLLTKGQYDEQKDKIDKSGLQPLFEELFIVAEKDDALYRMLLERHQWQADETCMIGNSPKSDINPALNMGMHAVYIPYEHTWHLDSGAAPEHHPRLRKLEFFSQLLEIF